MKALALLSGGLDSILAVKVAQEAGIEVEGMHLLIPFIQAEKNQKSAQAAKSAAQQLGIKLHLVECDAAYLELIKNPTYGYGKRMNPCLDCRIYQFQKAGELMSQIGASFLITGEVFNQRPNSQRRDAMDITVRDAHLKGLILRPLSAKLLTPTIPEEKGWIDREKLLDIKGRSRNRQFALAQKYQITDFPAPTGGCLVTYQEYSQKLADLLEHKGELSFRNVELLKHGRHLRLDPETKIIIGKNEKENLQLEALANDSEYLLKATTLAGPITLYQGDYHQKLLELAGEITAGYAKGHETSPTTLVTLMKKGTVIQEFQVRPLAKEESRRYFIVASF